MLIRAVSDDTMNNAKSFTDMRVGFEEDGAMDQILASAKLSNGRSIHLASLARQTLIDAGADHLGLEGYFLFECEDTHIGSGISVLGKAASIEAAFRIIDIWQAK